MREILGVLTTLKLTWPECELAAYAGMKRQLLALHDGRPDRHGFAESDAWGTHIESAASELAVARYTGLFWTAWARRPGDVTADVGADVQVRRMGERGRNLLLHREDPAGHRFVLASGTMPTFTLHGWIHGADGQAERYWGDPYKTGRPAFWVPKGDLLPVEDLLADGGGGAVVGEELPLLGLRR